MKTQRQRNSLKPLRNNCSRTNVFISPKDYKSFRSKSDLQKDWFVECRFYDPAFKEKYPKGFQFRRRPQKQTTLVAQKKIIEHYVQLMEKELDINHFNPISQTYMSDLSGTLNPNMDFKSALDAARLKLKGSDKHLAEVRIAVTRFIKSVDALNYSYLSINEIKIWHIKNTLDHCDLTDSYYNKFRQYLKDIFKELVERGCIDHNPVRDISKRKIVAKIRSLIPEEKLFFVDKFLEEKHYNFYRYKEIFYRSASRSSELLRLQRKHVFLEKQEYIIQIQKGKTYKWVVKPINIEALEYWKEIVDLCKSEEDYLFSKNLEPGKLKISPRQITIRWKRHVKDTSNIKDENGKVISITEDFYGFKYLYLDKLDAIQQGVSDIPHDFNLAQKAAAHTNVKTTNIYTVGKEKRITDILKRIKVG